MEIDVGQREKLLHHHDLDNYLYPVVRRLGASHFTLVSAIKRLGGGSYLQIGQTKPANFSPEKDGWKTLPVAARQVSFEFAPDPLALQQIADALNYSQRPALIVGASVDRDGAWDEAVELAERTRAAVGIALADPTRRIIGLLGDGSSMYSVQGLWTAVQHRHHLCYPQ